MSRGTATAGAVGGQRLLNALNDGSGKKSDADIQAIVQELRGHLDDPNYCAGYFAKLGPDMTLSAVQSLIPQGHGNFSRLPPGNPLQTFDEALAAAGHQDIGNPAVLQQGKAASGFHATDLTWQERLFITATTDHDGKVDATGYRTLTRAVQGWLQAKSDAIGRHRRDRQGARRSRRMGARVRTLVGLLNLGTIAGPFKGAADRQATLNMVNEIWGDLTTLIPPTKLVDLVGGNALAKKAFSLILTPVKAGVENTFTPDFPAANDNSLQVWRITSASARSMLTSEAVLGDPDVMPPDVRAAYERDPTSPAVENFITTVAQAKSMNDLNLQPTDPRYNQLANSVPANEALQGEIDPEFKVSFHN